MFERFATEARRTVTLAGDEAQRLGHRHLGTEHLLLGLLAQPQDPTARLLGRFGLDLDAGRLAVARTPSATASRWRRSASTWRRCARPSSRRSARARWTPRRPAGARGGAGRGSPTGPSG
ncbi:Clp protease N-terminal domain-containing protein [Kitasatospora griseola]|uniref:Clp protease N-terminal domain-containing protein n=1 Tax=Kitasatospora griseola TaxID=2064 RepID=UPI0036DB721F